MKRVIVSCLFAAINVWGFNGLVVKAAETNTRNIILSTTTSTQDSGLLDVLVPMFEKKSGYIVKVISVGTGQALALAAKGDADVALVHAPDLEKQYVAEKKLLNRHLVMYNDFVILGPREDPAHVRTVKRAVDALRLIERKGAAFVSRGDNSGTHILEKKLWKEAAIKPHGAWYIESGQGMGATLGIANERNAYTLSDRATYLAFKKVLELAVLLERDKPLLNIYSVMEVNTANGRRVNAGGGKAFADFMVSPETQAAIKTFGIQKYGQALFVPVAGMREEDLGR